MISFDKKIRFLFVLPTGMFFSKSQAGSIELCTHDIATSLYFKDISCVVGPVVNDPLCEHFIGIEANTVKVFQINLMKTIEDVRPDLVFINQQFRLAADVKNKFPHIKCVVYRHNGVKKRVGLSKLWMGWYLRRLDHLLFCSDYIRNEFSDNFPIYQKRASTLYNAINQELWHPQEKRKKSLLFIGRPTDDKGLLEFLGAAKLILNDYKDWTASVIISHAYLDKNYTDTVREFIENHDRIKLYENVEYSKIIEQCERAQIMVVPSKWAEPFGRTAIEALAGGAILISSGKGGLAEASEDAALYLDEITENSIYNKIKYVINNSNETNLLRKKGFDLIENKFSQSVVYSNLYKFLNALTL